MGGAGSGVVVNSPALGSLCQLMFTCSGESAEDKGEVAELKPRLCPRDCVEEEEIEAFRLYD